MWGEPEGMPHPNGSARWCVLTLRRAARVLGVTGRQNIAPGCRPHFVSENTQVSEAEFGLIIFVVPRVILPSQSLVCLVKCCFDVPGCFGGIERLNCVFSSVSLNFSGLSSCLDLTVPPPS